MLHSERQSVSDMRAALKRARGPEADAADAEREVHLLRDALESVTAERDQLTHEVAMVRETVRHNRLASAEAARTSRASDVAPDSFAGQFHAHAERIRELQTELEVRRPPRACMHADAPTAYPFRWHAPLVWPSMCSEQLLDTAVVSPVLFFRGTA